MGKHHAKKSLKSLFGNHINLEKEEQLKESKAEIKVKVKKALELIKDEELEKYGIEAGDSKKEPLAELIQDLHQKYESLYAQYDHLTGELKKRVHEKHDKESSSSSSSDSESNSSKEKGRKNGDLEDSFPRSSDNFKQMENAENANLRRKLTDSKNEALSTEYHMVLSKLQEAEENIKYLKTDAQRLDDEKTRLVLENKELHQKLDIGLKIETEVNQRQEVAEREKDSLKTEKETAMRMTKQEEKALDDLRDENIRFRDDNAFLQHELQAFKEEVSHLKQLLESAQSNKRDMEGQIERGTKQVENLMKEKQGLQAQNSELEIALKRRENDSASKIEIRDAVSLALKEKIEEEGKEAFSQITNLTTQVSSLKEELYTSQTLKKQMEQEFEIQKEKFSEILKTVENEKSELTKQVAKQQKMLKEQEVACENITQENKQIEASLQDCRVQLQEAEKRTGQMAEQFHKKSGSKESMVTYLEDIIEDLKRDLEVKKDEVQTLVENARTIEVKLRLSNQKIRITEQLLTEKEENFRELEAKYHQEKTALEERIAELCQSIDIHQNMIRDISEHVNNKFTGLEVVVDKFVDKCEDYEHYLLKILNELQLVKYCVTITRKEKEQLHQAVKQLTEQLEHENEQQLLLKEQVENLMVKSGNEDDVTENLAKVKNQLEKKIDDMETNIIALGEEKREAIRQLCLWVDYRQSRYDCLKEMMSKFAVKSHTTA